MLNLPRIVASAFAAGAIVLSGITPAFGATTIQISGNGSDSDNDVSVRVRHRTSINQSNSADIDNNVSIRTRTGGNDANRNTGGDVSITTGNSTSNVNISNQANVNSAGFNGNGFFNFFGTRLDTNLSGSQEVPGPGDPNGTGTARVWLFPSSGNLCVSLQVSNIDTATAAHIHQAPLGSAGPVVVTLPTPNSSGFASGCVNADSSKLEDIKNNPSNFYVNIHNIAFPDGAVRGQL